MKIHTNRAQHQ